MVTRVELSPRIWDKVRSSWEHVGEHVENLFKNLKGTASEHIRNRKKNKKYPPSSLVAWNF
jgi:hypothetical protein